MEAAEHADYERAVTINTHYDWDGSKGGGYRGQIAALGLVVWVSERFPQDYQALEAAQEHFVESMRWLFGQRHNDGYRPEDISVDESQWHGTPFTRGPELKDGDVAHDGYGCQCPQADDGRRMGTSSLCATHGEVEHSDGDET